MADKPANGATDWGTTMNAFLDVGHATDGTHNEAGMVAQVVNTITGAVNTGTTAMPFDDTIPQITEGDEYMTLAITPKNANNKLLIEISAVLSHSVGSHTITTALFQDATANALAATPGRIQAADATTTTILTHFMTAGTISAITFRMRAGGTTGATMTFNGSVGARKYGGVAASSITITEIWV